MTLYPVAQGFVLGASMIIPIGAQNTFLINQGAKRQHHIAAASVCAVSDFILIASGIFGGSQILRSSPTAFTILTWLGILFLAGYGGMSFRSALSTEAAASEQVVSGTSTGRSLSKVVIACLAVTLLNPHVYLDTVFILGGVGGQFEDGAKLHFALGCMLASLMWFFGLSIMASKMSHYLRRRRVRMGIEIGAGLVMSGIAWALFSSWQ